MSANFFEEVEQTQTPAPVRRKLDAAERRRAAARQAEREIEDEQALSKLYRQYRAGKRDALLAGPHGRDVAGIVAFMRTMTLSSAPALIEMVRGAGWIGAMSIDDRFVLLRLIADAVTRLRVSEGLCEFDDGLCFVGQPPKAFHQIKTLMGLDGQ